MPQMGIISNIASASAGAMTRIIKDGLVLWLKGSSGKDFSKEGNDGTLYSGKSLTFDGVSDVITTSDNTLTNGYTKMTIACWIYVENSTNSMMFSSKGTGSAGGTIWSIYYENANKNIAFNTLDNDTPNNVVSRTANNSIAIDTWHRLVVTMDFSTKEQKMYIDGVQSGDTATLDESGTALTTSTSYDVSIGAYYKSGGTSTAQYWDGKISDYQLWNAVWSSDDVYYDYSFPENIATDRTESSLITSNLKLWYPMNEGQPEDVQATIYDGSGNGLDVPSNFFVDLITEDNDTNMQSSTGNWVDYDGTLGTITIFGGYLLMQIGSGETSGGTKIDLSGDAGDETIVSGTQYRIRVTAYCDDATNTFRFGTATDYQDQTLATSFTDYSYTFTATGNENIVNFYLTSCDNGTFFYMDKVYIEKVGVRDGWTIADQQQKIPQVSIMDSSRKMIFDGTNNKIDCGNAAIRTSEMTYSAWIKNNGTTGQAVSHAITNYRVNFAFDSATLAVSSLSGSSSNTQHVSGSIVAGTWNHYCRVIGDSTDGTDSSNLFYINGILQDGTSGQAIHGTNKLMFGSNTNGSEYFDGFIDEISIWNHGFTLAQVRELYNLGVPLDANAHSKKLSLIGHWRNNGINTWSDLKGSNNGSVSGSPKTIYFPKGINSGRDTQNMFLTHPRNNNVFVFDGVNGHIDCGERSSLQITSDIFIEAWIKVNPTSGVSSVIISKSNQTLDCYNLLISEDGYPIFTVFNGGSGTSVTYSTNIADNEWHHIAAMYKPSTTMKIYVNAYLRAENTTSIPASIDNDDVNVIIGAYGDLTNSCNGYIDDIRVYNRILTDNGVSVGQKAGLEVLNNYNKTKGNYD